MSTRALERTADIEKVGKVSKVSASYQQQPGRMSTYLGSVLLTYHCMCSSRRLVIIETAVRAETGA